jgi:hypothetical protein
MFKSQWIPRALATIAILGAYAPVTVAQPGMQADGPYQVMSQRLPDDQVSVAVMLPGAARTDLAHYHGPCSEQVDADLSVNDRAAVSRFESSGKFADLDAEGLTSRLVTQLKSACPQLERVNVLLATRPDRPVVASFAHSAD